MSIRLGNNPVVKLNIGAQIISRVYVKSNIVYSGEWAPFELFAANEPGVWYDPSDFSTMFQDAAGTTPVTAVEQPVGLMLDKSGRGNHASQPTTTSRPVLSARVNLLRKTEQFDDAVWLKGNVAVTANAAVAPNGATSADSVAGSAGSISYFNLQVPVLAGIGYKFSIYAKKNTTSILQILGSITGFDQSYANFDLSNGTTGTVSRCVAEISSAEDGWWKCTVTQTAAGNDINNFFVALVGSKTSTRAESLSANASVYIWGADLRVANTGAGLPAYQRVNTATDYDTVGFPHYLRFDGVDDWLVTPTITPGTDKAQVFAGVRKIADGTARVIAELSENKNNYPGVIYLFGPTSSVGTDFTFGSKGTLDRPVSDNSHPAPATKVLTGLGDISGDSAILRVNGTQVAQSTSDQGTGNFLAYPLYIGRRGGTTLPFNGHIYGLIVRFGSNLPTATIEQTEKYINTKTRAY